MQHGSRGIPPGRGFFWEGRRGRPRRCLHPTALTLPPPPNQFTNPIMALLVVAGGLTCLAHALQCPHQPTQPSLPPPPQFTNPLMALLVIAGGLTYMAYALQSPRDRNNLILATALIVVVSLT